MFLCFVFFPLDQHVILHLCYCYYQWLSQHNTSFIPGSLFCDSLTSKKLFLKLTSAYDHTLDLLITISRKYITWATSICPQHELVHSKIFCSDLDLQIIGPLNFYCSSLMFYLPFSFYPIRSQSRYSISCKLPGFPFSMLPSFFLFGKALTWVILLKILSCSYSLLLLEHHFPFPTELFPPVYKDILSKTNKIQNFFINPCMYLPLLFYSSASFHKTLRMSCFYSYLNFLSFYSLFNLLHLPKVFTILCYCWDNQEPAIMPNPITISVFILLVFLLALHTTGNSCLLEITPLASLLIPI